MVNALTPEQHSLTPTQTIMFLHDLDKDIAKILRNPMSIQGWWVCRPWIGTYLYNTYSWEHPFVCSSYVDSESESVGSADSIWNTIRSNLPSIHGASALPSPVKHCYTNNGKAIVSLTGTSSNPRAHIQDFMLALEEMKGGDTGYWTMTDELNTVDPSEAGRDIDSHLIPFLTQLEMHLGENSELSGFLNEIGLRLRMSSIRNSYYPLLAKGFIFMHYLVKQSGVRQLFIDCSTDPFAQGAIFFMKQVQKRKCAEILHGCVIEEAYTPSLGTEYPLLYANTYISTDAVQPQIYYRDLPAFNIRPCLDIRAIPISQTAIPRGKISRYNHKRRILLIENTGEDPQINQVENISRALKRTRYFISLLAVDEWDICIRPHPVWGLNQVYTTMATHSHNIRIIDSEETLREAASGNYEAYLLPIESSSWKELIHFNRPMLFFDSSLVTEILSRRGLATTILSKEDALNAASSLSSVN